MIKAIAEVQKYRPALERVWFRRESNMYGSKASKKYLTIKNIHCGKEAKNKDKRTLKKQNRVPAPPLKTIPDRRNPRDRKYGGCPALC